MTEGATWILVGKRKPPCCVNVLLAFVHHWNAVVGFYCGKNQWYETNADDRNSPCQSLPYWWAEIPQVPNYGVVPTTIAAKAVGTRRPRSRVTEGKGKGKSERTR